MRMHSAAAWRNVRVVGSAFLCLASFPAGAKESAMPFGHAASPEEIGAVDIDVRPDGAGLPRGSGTVAEGREIYAVKCAACHGATGVEGPRDRLVGGQGSLASDKPVKTIGSYWQYAPTLYDYIHRAMPFTAPGTLTADEVYSLVAYLLNRNGVIEADQVVDRTSLPAVRMPNRDGFAVEPAFRNVRRPR